MSRIIIRRTWEQGGSVQRTRFNVVEDTPSSSSGRRRLKNRRVRGLIFGRTNGTCADCDDVATEIHHVLPSSQGGTNDPDNLIGLCGYHHKERHVWWRRAPKSDLTEVKT